MFSSRLVWTAVGAYLVVIGGVAWAFVELTTAFALPQSAVATLIWQVAGSVGVLGLFLTWALLRTAAVRLASLAETAALRDVEGTRGSSPSDLRAAPLNLESAIESMNRHLETRDEELQRKSRQLQDSTDRLETVLGSMVEGVIAVDRHQRILLANAAACELFEMSVPNLVGRPIWEAIRNPKIDQVIRTVLASGQTASLEIDVPRKHAVVALIVSRLPGSPTAGAVLVFHNVTELRRLESIRREFVSNVSHELKTPLTAIQAYTETLLDGAIEEPENRQRFVERIGEQANRLHALIQDLLQLARIESGEKIFEVRAVDVGRAVEECIDEQSAVAEAKSQQLSAEGPAAGVQVLVDEGGLHTILSNLIDNAVKYTPERGVITVRWRSENGSGMIEVSDNGPGIPEEHHPRIFERFYRVDKARSDAVEGTGLGLSIAKHLVQEFGGKVEVDSRPGRGATFVVRLPLA